MDVKQQLRVELAELDIEEDRVELVTAEQPIPVGARCKFCQLVECAPDCEVELTEGPHAGSHTMAARHVPGWLAGWVLDSHPSKVRVIVFPTDTTEEPR